MPTYEYGCTSCGHRWEEIQKITEPAFDTCTKCDEKTAQRLISGGTFILKGGGWYADAYSSPAPKKLEPSDSKGSEGKAGESKSGGGESKSGGAAKTPAEPSASVPSTPADTSKSTQTAKE